MQMVLWMVSRPKGGVAYEDYIQDRPCDNLCLSLIGEFPHKSELTALSQRQGLVVLQLT